LIYRSIFLTKFN